MVFDALFIAAPQFSKSFFKAVESSLELAGLCIRISCVTNLKALVGENGGALYNACMTRKNKRSNSRSVSSVFPVIMLAAIFILLPNNAFKLEGGLGSCS